MSSDEQEGYGEEVSLVRLAREKQTEQLIALLNEGRKPDDQNEQGQTALHWACKTNSQQLVKALLDARACPDLEDGSCYTALHFAVLGHHTACARMLLEAGANPNARRLTGQTSLHIAAKNNHHDLVQLLLDFNADCNILSGVQETALHTSTENTSPEIVSMLLHAGIDPTVVNSQGDTAFHKVVTAILHYNYNPSVTETRVEVLQRMLDHKDGKSKAFHVPNAKGQTPVDVLAEEYWKSPSREMTYVLKILMESKVVSSKFAKEQIMCGVIRRTKFYNNTLLMMLPYFDRKELVVSYVKPMCIHLSGGVLSFHNLRHDLRHNRYQSNTRTVTWKQYDGTRAEQFLRITRILCEVACIPPSVEKIEGIPPVDDSPADNNDEVPWDKSDEVAIEEAIQVWREYSVSGPTLQALARSCVRSHMNSLKPESFSNIPIPGRLQQYVSLSELRNLEY